MLKTREILEMAAVPLKCVFYVLGPHETFRC
jgi:hypothetical protein